MKISAFSTPANRAVCFFQSRIFESCISAAFDTIRHSLLLSGLETDYGVHSTVLSWLESYLTGRQQFVKLGRHSSA